MSVSVIFLVVVHLRVLQSLWELLLRMILDTVGENRGVQVEFYTRFQYTVEVSMDESQHSTRLKAGIHCTTLYTTYSKRNMHLISRRHMTNEINVCSKIAQIIKNIQYPMTGWNHNLKIKKFKTVLRKVGRSLA